MSDCLLSNFHKCEICGRDGKLVRQELVPYNPILKIEPWVFRCYMCQWHRAAKTKDGFDVTPIEFIPDEELYKANTVIPRA
ncbi:hypothetical protein A7M79_07400 [Acinetobacter baumannii]|uniref:hypothetical protein n=1 Tax=Acinetobacter baumannii TaxID=470 RepID=UPI0008DCFDD5|nr:hypothetical protein [Acinetobacter baumannii]OIH08632.1 hypothetical protein A7M79_07400 [Acinetobacter baumannii]